MHALKSVLAAAAVSCALVGGAAAMPADHFATQDRSTVEKVVWVCGPYRCFWRPPVRYYYAPRAYVGPRWVCGPYRCFRRW